MTVGQEWAPSAAKVVSLAKQQYLAYGDVLSYKRLLALNVDAKILLLKRLSDHPGDRFRCSGLYETVLEAMSIGLWDKAAEIVRLSNAEFVARLEHSTDFHYARLLGDICSAGLGDDSCIALSDVRVKEPLLQENSIFKHQALFIQAISLGDSNAVINQMKALIEQSRVANGACERLAFMKQCQSATGDIDAECALVGDLEEAESMIDIELIALAALARHHTIKLPLEDYDACPSELQLLSLAPDSA